MRESWNVCKYSTTVSILLMIVSPTDLFAACQNVEREDEEEVGPTPSPGCLDGCVPIWPQNNRTGGGGRFKQNSEQHFLPLSNSQVRDVSCNMRACSSPQHSAAIGGGTVPQ